MYFSLFDGQNHASLAREAVVDLVHEAGPVLVQVPQLVGQVDPDVVAQGDHVLVNALAGVNVKTFSKERLNKNCGTSVLVYRSGVVGVDGPGRVVVDEPAVVADRLMRRDVSLGEEALADAFNVA